jgi:hypothetical protein
MPITLNGDTGITTPTYGGSVTAEYSVPVTAFKNRIINGAMQIDQYNAGASVTATATFPVDRFITYKDTVSGTLTGQRSTIAPAGFTNSLSYTITSAFTPSSSEGNSFVQVIEGFNIADLGWGTASASSVTVSFWIRSSVTGTYGGSLRNNGGSRSYPFSYTITSANTWEYKTITVPGDTTGTWLTTNGAGLYLFFSLGTGSTLSGTAGAWAASNFINVTGATNITSTSGATFYITGVQLEKGSTATSFDYRPYGTELALCQRYYLTTALMGVAVNTGEMGVSVSFKVNMRTSPSLNTDLRSSSTYLGAASNKLIRIGVGEANVGAATSTVSLISDTGISTIYCTGLVSGGVYGGSCALSAEL